MKSKLIASCGMNCSICKAYLREKNKCPGCRFADIYTSTTRLKCIIKVCGKRKNPDFCFSCDTFPCARLKHLDKRYRTKYSMSMIENLNFIKDKGIREFMKNEKQRWLKEGKIFCVHDKTYYEQTNN